MYSVALWYNINFLDYQGVLTTFNTMNFKVVTEFLAGQNEPTT